MFSLKEFLIEELHQHGTYACLKLDPDSQSKLREFVNSLGIQGKLVSPEDYHCTVIYSCIPCPAAADHHFLLPAAAQPLAYDLFDKGCLVLKLDAPEVSDMHRDLRQVYGAYHDYPDYKPHITLAYDYLGEIPSILPSFPLIFTVAKVEGLKPTWSSMTDEQTDLQDVHPSS